MQKDEKCIKLKPANVKGRDCLEYVGIARR
jgi:hypothetical protein